MKEKNDGFMRADQIDLKNIDEQLERHFNKALVIDHNDDSNSVATDDGAVFNKNQRQDWEIDPSNLIIKTVIARGTFGTVHRGVYDAQDVAGNFRDQFYLIQV